MERIILWQKTLFAPFWVTAKYRESLTRNDHLHSTPPQSRKTPRTRVLLPQPHCLPCLRVFARLWLSCTHGKHPLLLSVSTVPTMNLRNTLCSCGSGQKYKKCHGSEPFRSKLRQEERRKLEEAIRERIEKDRLEWKSLKSKIY